MTYELYSIKDRFSGFWSPRVFMNKPTAIRDFQAMVNSDPSSIVYLRPGDFSLYKMGTFNTEEGIYAFKEPEPICEGLSLKKGESFVLEPEDFDEDEGEFFK